MKTTVAVHLSLIPFDFRYTNHTYRFPIYADFSNGGDDKIFELTDEEVMNNIVMGSL